jgi:hypothetical protein
MSKRRTPGRPRPAAARGRQSPPRPTGTAKPIRSRLTLPLGDAAMMVGVSKRTLRELLRGEPCLVPLAHRLYVDRKGFAEWCRRQGILTEPTELAS